MRTAKNEVRVNFADDVHDRLRKRAKTMGRPITYIVHYSVMDYLDRLDEKDRLEEERKRRRRAERLLPPIDEVPKIPRRQESTEPTPGRSALDAIRDLAPARTKQSLALPFLGDAPIEDEDD